MPRVRLGVVLLLPEPVAAEVDGLRRALGDTTRRFVPPHITLVPPVNVAVADVEPAVAVVRRAAGRAEGPLEVTIGAAATFAPVTPVVYLPVSGDTALLRALRDDVLSGPLGRPPEWPFVPHVTILPDATPGRATAAVEALADYTAAVSLEGVHLLQEGDDRTWRPLADFSLGPAAVIGRGGLPVSLAVSEGLDPEATRFFEAAWREHEADSYGEGAVARPFAVAARREGEVVGVALGSTGASSGSGESPGSALEARLDRLVVSTAARHQGVGTHLLGAVEGVAQQRGCTRVVLVAQAGGPAQAFYASRGWVVERALPNWRYGRDFVCMVRELR